MSIIVENLSCFSTTFSGDLFLSIPSSGHDRTLPKLGFPEADPLRRRSMGDNTVCRHLVMDDGQVSGGHITLAGYR